MKSHTSPHSPVYQTEAPGGLAMMEIAVPFRMKTGSVSNPILYALYRGILKSLRYFTFPDHIWKEDAHRRVNDARYNF
jgi:hypothetical protein